MKLMGRKIGTHNKYINIIHKNTSANKLKRNRKFFSIVHDLSSYIFSIF